MILAVSVNEDLHALAVQHAVRRRGNHDFHIIECDTIGGRASISWSSSRGTPSSLMTSEGMRIAPEEATVLWWRRARSDQNLDGLARDDQEKSLINNDCRGALSGALTATFRGTWVSPPEATDRAADKLYQLTVAQKAGFRVPRTLISQSRDEVVEFVERTGRVIVKPVVGARGPSLWTAWMSAPESIPRASFEACPATYQEYIEGSRHIRLNCFGDSMYAAVIETDELDWRPDLGVPISTWKVPVEIEDRVRLVLRTLGLRMGIIDLKLMPDGEPVWLEVNPQGQFLFLEPLTGEPLTEHFADFLVALADEELAERRRLVSA